MLYITIRDKNEAEPFNTIRKDKARDFFAYYPRFQTTNSLTGSFAIQSFYPSPFNLFILRYSTSLSFAIQPPYPSLFNLTFAETRWPYRGTV